MDRSHAPNINGASHAPGLDVTRRAALGAGGALAVLMAVGGQTGVAAQGATPQATPQGAIAAEPQLEWIGTLSVQLGQPIIVGETAHGTRLLAPQTGGTFTGPNLTAMLVPPGGDWLLIRPDGVGELNARGILQTEDGAMLYLTMQGYVTRLTELLPRWAQGEEIPREEYYFVGTPYFETGAPEYDWLEQTVTIAMGALVLGGVAFDIYAVR